MSRFFIGLGKTVAKSGVGMERINENDDIDMTVELDLMDGKKVTCAIVTILTVNEKDYIVLLPLDDEGKIELLVRGDHVGHLDLYRVLRQGGGCSCKQRKYEDKSLHTTNSSLSGGT